MGDDRSDGDGDEHRQRDRCREAMREAELELAAGHGERRRERAGNRGRTQPGPGAEPASGSPLAAELTRPPLRRARAGRVRGTGGEKGNSMPTRSSPRRSMR